MNDPSSLLIEESLLGASHRDDCPGCSNYAKAIERLADAINALTHQVSTDHVTRAMTRSAMEDAVHRELQRARRFGHPASLVICDIDSFKFVNDAYGHAVGDQVLKRMCAELQAACRDTDLVGRWGGEEFAVLMPNTAAQDAAVAAESMRHAVRTAAYPHGLHLTASFGVAQAVASEKWQDWVRRADHAMFEAKRNGRNGVVTAGAGDLRAHAPYQLMRLTWRPSYCSGHPLLDRQHEALFEVANAVLTVAVAGDMAQTSVLFGGLVQECRAHFADEEQLLADAHHPTLEAHAATHRQLLAAAEQMQVRLASGQATTTALFEFIARDLIAGHILKEDREHHPLISVAN